MTKFKVGDVVDVDSLLASLKARVEVLAIVTETLDDEEDVLTTYTCRVLSSSKWDKSIIVPKADGTISLLPRELASDPPRNMY